jgi:hypothetical protein
MSNRTKERLLKVYIVFVCAYGLFAVLGLPIIWSVIGKTFKEMEKKWFVALVAWFISGGILIVVTSVIEFEQTPTKAEKLKLLCEDFAALALHFETAANMRDYLELSSFNLGGQHEMRIFARRRQGMLQCFVLARLPELTPALMNEADERFWEFAANFYGTSRITATVQSIMVVCVDRITPAFQKLVNSNIQQNFRNHKLPVGISFGGKRVYVAKQEGGFVVGAYKKMKKEFLSMLGDMAAELPEDEI